MRILFGLKKSPKYEYYLVWKNRPNTNTSIRPQLFEYRIIRLPLSLMGFIMTSFMRSLILILFGLKKLTKYEYEYYSVSKNRPNTNTNIIRLEKITRIRIRILVFASTIQIIFQYWIIRSPLFTGFMALSGTCPSSGTTPIENRPRPPVLFISLTIFTSLTIVYFH